MRRRFVRVTIDDIFSERKRGECQSDQLSVTYLLCVFVLLILCGGAGMYAIDTEHQTIHPKYKIQSGQK